MKGKNESQGQLVDETGHGGELAKMRQKIANVQGYLRQLEEQYDNAIAHDSTGRKQIEETLHWESTQTETFYGLSRKLNAARDEIELLQVLVQFAIQVGAVQANLVYTDMDNVPEPRYAEIVAMWNHTVPPSPPVAAKRHLNLAEFFIIHQWASNPNEPLCVADVATDERMDKHTRGAMDQLGIRALVSIPLTQSGRWIGFVNLGWDEPREIYEQEIKTFRTLGNLVSPAVEHRRLVDNLEQMVAERTMLLGTASDIAGQVNAILDSDELLNTVISLLKERFGLYHVHVYMLDEDAKELRLQAGYGEPGRILLEQRHKISLDQAQSPIARAARTREIVAVNDVTQEPDYVPHPLLPNTKSEVAVPLIVPSPTGDQIWGIFAAQHDKVHYFTPVYLNVFSTLARQIATALQNAALFEEIQIRFDVSQALVSVQTEDEVLDALIQQTNIHPMSAVSILLWDKVEQLTLVAARFRLFDSGILMAAEGMRFPVAHFPLTQFITPNEPSKTIDPFVTTNVFSDERVDPTSRMIAGQMGIVSFTSAPIMAGSGWLGAIVAMSKEEGYFDRRKQHLYRTLADQGAMALQAACLRTEIQASEERFRRLSNSTLEGIVIHAGGVVLDVNQALATMVGYDSPEELIGTGVFETLVMPETFDDIRDKIRSGCEGVYEGVGVRKDGSTFPFQVSLVPYRGREVGVVAIRDITERKQAEQELGRYREHLEELVEERTRELEEAQMELVRKERLSALGQLTATVAHEIRNPLGTVRNAIFALGDVTGPDADGEIKFALQLAERNIIRCDNIIRELLDYTRSRELQLELTHIDTWLNEVLDEQAIPKGIVCVRELTCDVEIPLDREYLRRAVINVVENGIDALQDEQSPGNRLTVSTHIVGKQPDLGLEIRVSDTGCGIPANVLDRIFEPLFSTKTFGVGLGMSVVKSIMDHHGGRIKIQSRESADAGQPRGTTVILWLPIQE